MREISRLSIGRIKGKEEDRLEIKRLKPTKRVKRKGK